MSAPEQAFEILLDFLKRNRGFDFTGYKRSSLERRISKRMNEIGIESYLDYIDHLEVHPEEFAYLFNTILINVTGFFRDPAHWEFLSKEIVPQVIDASDGRAIRIWVAGCSSGEEAYTTAMVFAEALGEPAYLERVKVYATDVDEEALATARSAIYGHKLVEDVPTELQERYFDRVDQRFAFRPELRRTVIYGRNDLVQDAPISRIDLLLCRNTLMYFNAETQEKILRRFNFALNDDGFLFLGRSEMLLTHSDLFVPVDLKRRVFRKVPKHNLRERLMFVVQGGADAPEEVGPSIRENAFDAAPVAQIVVDDDDRLVLANQQARAAFGLHPSDIGRPIKDIEVSYRPVELRAHLEQVRAEHQVLRLSNVIWRPPSGEPHRLDVQITPLVSGGATLGASITYLDVTEPLRLREESERAKRELDAAYEELQSTVEELETTNEELQSTNEELETTNEELQSTNEELETMNEELQSANEELETINDELRQRSLELDEVNSFLEAILASMGVAVVVVDRQQVVQVWNDQAEDLWGVRSDEAVGQHFLSLDIGLPLESVKQALRSALSDPEAREEMLVPATNRRGQAIECRVSCLPLARAGGEITGAIVLMDPVPAAEPAAQRTEA